jgi:hypothetical protein
MAGQRHLNRFRVSMTALLLGLLPPLNVLYLIYVRAKVPNPGP